MCTFVQKVRLAQEAGAKGIIIVSDSNQVEVMGTDNSTDAEKVDIFAVGVTKSFGDELLTSLGRDSSAEPLVMSFSVYEPSILDISEALLICLATSLVVAGAFFATADLRQGSPLAPRSNEEVVDVTTEFAFGFCLLGSAMLVVLFFFMKYLIFVIIFFFCVGGVSCIAQLSSTWLQYSFPRTKQPFVTVPLVGAVSYSEAIGLVPAAVLVLGWVSFRNAPQGWVFQDIIGAGFLCMIQRTLRLSNMKIATILLSLMFFFDIFWVFVSPLLFQKSVMVTVATGGGTGESVPMLLRLPSFGDPFGHERMLGFGDVALPGLLVSYLRRHDVLSKRPWFAGYFLPAVVGYFVGLCVTIVALMVMQMGQPALLYLVPGTLGTTLVIALWRAEFSCLWEGVPARSSGVQQAGVEGQNFTESYAGDRP